MDVGIYTRSATGDAAQLRDQERRCRDDAVAHGWTVIRVWTDSGSGLTEDRPGLSALREAMAARHVEVVLVTDTARLARDDALVDRLQDEAVATGVALVLLDGVADPSLGRLLMAKRGALDHLELECFRAKQLVPGIPEANTVTRVNTKEG